MVELVGVSMTGEFLGFLKEGEMYAGSVQESEFMSATKWLTEGANDAFLKSSQLEPLGPL